MNEHLERYKLIFEHFKLMEQRYHTWMNYYSLFNGALLVAYCTILVSTGEVVETGNTVTQDSYSTVAHIFRLSCTYWEFLFLIAVLGIVASVCWLLSIIGHVHWLESWRHALKSNGYRFDWAVYGVAPEMRHTDSHGFHYASGFFSTAKITRIFVWAVIVAWMLAAGYTYLLDGNENSCMWCFILVLIAVLPLGIIGFIVYCCKRFLYSDMSSMVYSDPGGT